MEHTPSPTVATAPARAGLHARRAAAARRRALLTVTLLVLTAATGVLAATSAVSGWFVLAPAALLAAVLVLGRRSVRANALADAAWEARERGRRAARPGPRLAGRPAPAVRPQVTGHAVKSSQSHTQMIARVNPGGVGGAGAVDADVVGPDAVGAGSGSGDAAGTGHVAGTGDAAGSAADTGEADAAAGEAPGAAEWVAVPVPRPVYTMKSAAPRWDPAPLTAEMAQITLARRSELAAGDRTPKGEGEPAASATDEAEVPSDSLGVNLDSVLARRRAAGE